VIRREKNTPPYGGHRVGGVACTTFKVSTATKPPNERPVQLWCIPARRRVVFPPDEEWSQDTQSHRPHRGLFPGACRRSVGPGYGSVRAGESARAAAGCDCARATAAKNTLAVIWTENPDVVQRFNVDGARVRQMVDASSSSSPAPPISARPGPAWASRRRTWSASRSPPWRAAAFQPSRHRPGHLRRPAGGGVPPSHIIIWDKDASDMRSAGYAPAPATDSRAGIASIFPAPVTTRMPSTKMRFSAR